MPATRVEQAAVDQTFRREFGRAVATLVCLLGDAAARWFGHRGDRQGLPGARVHHGAAAGAGQAQDWNQILALYDQLLVVSPTPVVALNRAVAVAEVHGPDLALAAVDDLDLDTYHLFHATRADLLRRLGRRAEAVEAYDAALRLTANAAERGFLEDRRRSVSP